MSFLTNKINEFKLAVYAFNGFFIKLTNFLGYFGLCVTYGIFLGWAINTGHNGYGGYILGLTLALILYPILMLIMWLEKNNIC